MSAINTSAGTLNIEPTGAPCGALLRGLNLSQPLPADAVAAIRRAWLDHQVVAFPDQSMSIEDLERFAQCLGPYGEDPYIAPIAGHPHVIEVKREADETTPIFADNWHSDWSFLPTPPAATALYGSVVPPVGGDTLFANQYDAWDALSVELKTLLKDRKGIHSARLGYARKGRYGDRDQQGGRSMSIRPDDSAMRTRTHPIARKHPETGRLALFVSPGYTIGIEGLPDDESRQVLDELFRHQGEDRFVYRHRWSSGMLTVWDNRCLIHAATGGYQGYRRLLHRITIADRAPVQ